MERRVFRILTLSFAIAAFLLIPAIAQPPMGPPMNPPMGPAGKIMASRKGLNFTLSTDLFTVRFAGSLQVPKFQYWYNDMERPIVYQVFFHQLFEFNDTDGDGVYNATAGDKMERMFALPNANADLTLSEPVWIENDTGDVIGVRFNFTMTGREELEGTEIIFQCSLYNETQTLVGAGGTVYNVTGGAELKIDVIIEGWPWRDDDNLLCLWWSVNQQNGTVEPSLTDGTVNFGMGYFKWLSEATVDGTPVDVNSSFNMIGRTVNIYMCYPHFEGRLIHDPSLGVTLPSSAPSIPGVPSGALAFNYPDLVPRRFLWNVPADTPMVLSFRNFALILDSGRDVDLNLTVDSGITMHRFSLSLEPGESLNLSIQVSVTRPSDIGAPKNGIGVYFDIDPTPGVTVEGTLRLYIDEDTLEAELHRDIDVSRLSWAYWDGSRWVTVESHIDSDGYLVAETSHLSTWTIVEVPATPWALYGLTAICLVVVLVVGVFVASRRRAV